jgi:flavin-dependent dehydrogenase
MTARRVIVAGNGPAGLAAALELAGRGFAVVLCAVPEPRRQLPGETLPASARAALEQLGLWERLERDGELAIPGRPIRQVWGSATPTAETSALPPSWHICRARFDAALREKALAAGVQFLTETTVTGAAWDKDGWRVGLRSEDGGERTIMGDFLLDATGRRARIARAMEAQPRAHSRLVAVRLRFEESTTEAGSRDSALRIETHAVGWACAAPLPQERLAVAVFTDADLLPGPITHVGSRDFLVEHFPYVAERVGSATLLDPPTAMPAHDGTLSLVSGERWMAVGDAAATFDPLSSSGILFALGSALEVARAVEGCLSGRGDAARAEYEAAVALFCSQARQRLLETYALERRWTGAPFWARRHVALARHERSRRMLMLSDAVTQAAAGDTG